jgi:hypothetical protein
MLTWSETVRKAFDGWKEVVESVLRVGKYQELNPGHWGHRQVCYYSAICSVKFVINMF